MPDAGRQIWEIRVPRDVELTPLENRNEQEKNKDNEKRTKRNEKIKRMRDEWKDNEKRYFMKWSWSDHPETQFGSTYPFFRNPEPKPTLRT